MGEYTLGEYAVDVHHTEEACTRLRHPTASFRAIKHQDTAGTTFPYIDNEYTAGMFHIELVFGLMELLCISGVHAKFKSL